MKNKQKTLTIILIIALAAACSNEPGICAPTRNVLMTGQHTGHTIRRGNRANDEPELPFLQRKLIPLREAGYATGMIGKWGLGNPGTTGTPDKQGFDYYFGYVDQVHAHNYYSDYLMRIFLYLPSAMGTRE